jgi:hypothetical protein
MYSGSVESENETQDTTFANMLSLPDRPGKVFIALLVFLKVLYHHSLMYFVSMSTYSGESHSAGPINFSRITPCLSTMKVSGSPVRLYL